MAVETLDQNQRQRSQYINFWNSVLVPKFICWKHILVDGLTLHSEAIFPTLAVKAGDKVAMLAADSAIPRSSWLSWLVLLGRFWLSIAAMLFSTCLPRFVELRRIELQT
jgi:hypothetical protein